MKNKIKIIVFVLFIVLIQGCQDWVNFDPKDEYKITDADYLRSESDYQTMVVSTYSPLQWLNQAMVIGDVASDNAVTGGENASDVLNLQQIDDYTVTTNNGALEEIWKACYEGINRTNYLTAHKDANPAGEQIKFAGKDALYGEVYFNRAYYYFTLVKFFGNVVLFTDKKLGVADFGSLTQVPKTEVYAQIEKDLKDAIAVLPAEGDQPGRITKYAAEALLGKVLIYQEKFNEAIPYLEDVIAGPFSLVDNFGDIFLYEGENGPESVFEIQYSNKSPYYNWGGFNRGQGNYAVQQCGVRGLSGTADMPYAPGWSTNLPTQELAKAYEAGDQRKDETCFDVEAYKNDSTQFKVTYQVAPYKNTGLYNKKYLPRKGQTSGQVELNYENNQRIIRFSEVLLLAAEAYNRSTSPNDAKAQEYLNRVRRRAFGDTNHDVSATGDALKKLIWRERRLELAMEGDRFFDLVRTGQATSVISGFVAGKNEIFPIPQKEIEISGLTQNPNW